jgi:hypothetical protein
MTWNKKRNFKSKTYHELGACKLTTLGASIYVYRSNRTIHRHLKAIV